MRGRRRESERKEERVSGRRREGERVGVEERRKSGGMGRGKERRGREERGGGRQDGGKRGVGERTQSLSSLPSPLVLISSVHLCHSLQSHGS